MYVFEHRFKAIAESNISVLFYLVRRSTSHLPVQKNRKVTISRNFCFTNLPFMSIIFQLRPPMVFLFRGLYGMQGFLHLMNPQSEDHATFWLLYRQVNILANMNVLDRVLWSTDHILKQKSLATQNLVCILFIIKIPVLEVDQKLIAQVCQHVSYPIIVMLDWLYTPLYRSTCDNNRYPFYLG